MDSRPHEQQEGAIPAPPAPLRRLRGVAVGWLFSLRGAMVLLIGVAALAIVVAVRHNQRARREEQILEAYDRANALYERGDLAGARQGFEEARRLIRSLGGGEHFLAAEVDRKFHESRIVADLLPVTLDELARRAYRAVSSEAWLATFRKEYRTRTVIFETTLLPRASVSGPPGPIVEYEVCLADGRRLAMDFSTCGLFAGPAWQEGMTVVFAAALDRMTFNETAGAENDRWTLHFTLDGYLLIQDERLLRSSGFEVSEETADVIARQRDAARGARRGATP